MNVDGDALTDLLTYNSTTGAAVFSVAIPGSPGARRTVRTVEAAPGWTTVVPMNLDYQPVTDLLSYNATTGLSIYSVAASPSRPGVQTIVSILKQADCRDLCAQGWTSIVPMNINGDALTDLLFYNAATGLAIQSVGNLYGGGEAGLQRTVATVSAAPGWTSIVPMDLNGDALTDLLSYNAGDRHGHLLGRHGGPRGARVRAGGLRRVPAAGSGRSDRRRGTGMDHHHAHGSQR
jgi:hypothetical protein